MIIATKKGHDKMKEVNIRFTGYYNSGYSEIIEQAVEGISDDENIAYKYGYDYNTHGDIEDFLRMREIDIEAEKSLIEDSVNYTASQESLNDIYVNHFTSHINEHFGLDIQLKYSRMESPREYNFMTDRLFCAISEGDIAKLYLFAVDNLRSFRMVLNNNFTPRSGFIPNYSKDLNKWLAKPLTEYDQNELHILLEVLIYSEYQEDEDNTFNSEVYNAVFESAICNGNFEIVTTQPIE